MRVEVLGGAVRRRRWSRNEKMRSLVESLEPGAKVAEVARRNDVAPIVLFAGRRQARLLVSTVCTTMVPVKIAEPAIAPSVITKPRGTRGQAERGLIEIDFGGGRRVWVDEGADAKALARVRDVLSSR